MVNKRLLVSKLKDKNLTLEWLAGEIGVNPSTLHRKLNGESDFARPEIIVVKLRLNLSVEEVNSIFFNEV